MFPFLAATATTDLVILEHPEQDASAQVLHLAPAFKSRDLPELGDSQPPIRALLPCLKQNIRDYFRQKLYACFPLPASLVLIPRTPPHSLIDCLLSIGRSI